MLFIKSCDSCGSTGRLRSGRQTGFVVQTGLFRTSYFTRIRAWSSETAELPGLNQVRKATQREATTTDVGYAASRGASDCSTRVARWSRPARLTPERGSSRKSG